MSAFCDAPGCTNLHVYYIEQKYPQGKNLMTFNVCEEHKDLKGEDIPPNRLGLIVLNK